jgi:hypothetical protein
MSVIIDLLFEFNLFASPKIGILPVTFITLNEYNLIARDMTAFLNNRKSASVATAVRLEIALFFRGWAAS